MDIQLTDQPIKPLSSIEGCENGIDPREYVNAWIGVTVKADDVSFEYWYRGYAEYLQNSAP